MRAPRKRASPALILLIPTILGCTGDGWPDRHPTQTRVLFEGKPPVGAVIRLEPVSGFTSSSVCPKGIVQEDGSVLFTTYTPGDGAPAGDYLVSAAWYPNGTPPNRLPERYLDPSVTGLRVTINPGSNEIPTLQLTK